MATKKWESMTIDELGESRAKLKRDYLEEYEASGAVLRAKVADERMADQVKAMGLPEGSRIIIEVPTTQLAAEGQ